MDMKLLKYLGICVGVLVLIMLFLILINGGTSDGKFTYDKIEVKLVDAAKKYVADKQKQNVDVLPDSPLADAYYLSANVLESEGYIKNISELAKDETTCVGGVNIYNAGGGKYDYVPDLTCGSFYQTVKLVDKVIADNDSGVVQGSGLYQRIDGKFVLDEQDLNRVTSDDFEYVFRGDEVNNYVKIDDNLWRIVSIDNENNMLLIYNEHSQRALAWDDKYNPDINKYQGINTFISNGIESTA